MEVMFLQLEVCYMGPTNHCTCFYKTIKMKQDKTFTMKHYKTLNAKDYQLALDDN